MNADRTKGFAHTIVCDPRNRQYLSIYAYTDHVAVHDGNTWRTAATHDECFDWFVLSLVPRADRPQLYKFFGELDALMSLKETPQAPPRTTRVAYTSEQVRARREARLRMVRHGNT